jgi:hypothetical protein
MISCIHDPFGVISDEDDFVYQDVVSEDEPTLEINECTTILPSYVI